MHRLTTGGISARNASASTSIGWRIRSADWTTIRPADLAKCCGLRLAATGRGVRNNLVARHPLGDRAFWRRTTLERVSTLRFQRLRELTSGWAATFETAAG